MSFRTISRVVIGGIIVVFVLVALAATLIAHRSPTAAPPPKFAGVGADLGGTAAPNFSLRDQNGRLVTMRGQRGHVVLVTFFYTHCPDTCPMTSQKLRTILRGFGREAHRVRVLIVATDPLHDNPTDATAFLREHGLSYWHFLLGTYKQLQPVWKRFGVYVPSPSQLGRVGPTHTAGMYLIDAKGREQVYLDDTVPAENISQDLHILLHDGRWRSTAPVAPQVGGRAPSFSLASMRSGNIRLRSFGGKPVLINFWATWCIPCRSEMPLLEREYRHYKGRLQILGVDEQEPASEVRAYTRALHITYPVAMDTNGDVSYSYQLNGTPTSFFVDRHGVIRYIQRGPSTQGITARQVRTLLGS